MTKPKDLFNKNRLDLIVKYLFAKEILERKDNLYTENTYKDLYIRHILMRTGGQTSSLETVSKNNADEYCSEFENLIENIKRNGFNDNYPVEAAPNGLLANGAHRVAAAMALNKEISIIENQNGHSWDFNWFCENGFNTEDKQRILKGFVDLKSENCIIFVVWNPLFKYLDNAKSIINKYFDIVGDVELDFEDNYIAFTNSLLEIYERNIAQNNGDESGILAKSEFLKHFYLSYKVIVATNEQKNDNSSLSELSKTCKDEIRNLFNHILPKDIFCTLHSSDGEDETKYLANILLSPNNIKHLKMRLTTDNSKELINKIRNLPNFLNEKGIAINDISVIGSGVMAALGVYKNFNSDIDFIIDHKYREDYGWAATKLSDNYEIGVSSKFANGPIHDNILIHNDNYHFWFKGIKFMNLELVRDRKSSKARSKDDFHLRQIELFEKMLGNINQQKILMSRIEIEKQRRLQIQNQFNMINVKVSYSNCLEKIFSIKNEISKNKKYKVLTVLGIKFKFRKG